MRQGTTTIRITDDQRSTLDAVAARLHDPIVQAALTPSGCDIAKVASALDVVSKVLTAAGRGDVASLRPPAHFVPLTEVRATLRVSDTGLRRWLDQRRIEVHKEGNFGYLTRADFEALRAWRVSLAFPDVD